MSRRRRVGALELPDGVGGSGGRGPLVHRQRAEAGAEIRIVVVPGRTRTRGEDELLAAGRGQALEQLDTGAREPALECADAGLRRAGTAGELGLAETVPGAKVTDEGRTVHTVNGISADRCRHRWARRSLASMG